MDRPGQASPFSQQWPLGTVPDEETAKLVKKINDLEALTQDLYDQLEQRDGVIIPKHEERVKELESQKDRLSNENRAFRAESKSFDRALKEEKSRLQAEQDEHERTRNSLQGWEKKGKSEEARANRAESRVDDIRQQYLEMEKEFDDQKAMIASLHRMVDEVQDECDRARADAEVNDDAARRLQEIEDTFEPIFQELGLELNPHNLIERFTSMHNKSVQRRDDQEPNLDAQLAGRPSLQAGRKVSMASIGDELSMLESDDESDAEPELLLHNVKSRNSDISPTDVSDQKDAKLGSTEEGLLGNSRDSRRQSGQMVAEEPAKHPASDLNESWTDVDPGSFVQDDARGLRQPDIAKDGPEGTDTLGDGEDAPPRTSDEVTQESSTANNGEAVTQDTRSVDIIQEVPVLDDEALRRRRRDADLIMEMEKQILELQRQLGNRAPHSPVVPVKPQTKYVSIIREATFLEALERAPWWMKLLVMLMVLAWAAMTTSAWRERNLWLASNDTTFLHGRRLQSNTNQCHWAFIEWFESYIGLDKRLLG